MESLPKLWLKTVCYFLRTGIKPTWEDPRNRDGGCFSYKVSNKRTMSEGVKLCPCW